MIEDNKYNRLAIVNAKLSIEIQEMEQDRDFYKKWYHEAAQERDEIKESAKEELNKALETAKKIESTFSELKDVVKEKDGLLNATMTERDRLQEGYNILYAYWDSLPDKAKPQIIEDLKAIGL